MAIFALWQVNHLASQIQRAEEDKVRLWANAISQKNQLVKYTEDFFAQITTDEQRKMDLYAQVLRTLGNEDLRADIEFSLSYVNYIMDSTRTSTIITNHDGYITSCRNIMNDSLDANLIGQKLEGQLLEAFSQNPPFEYTVWGMQFTLYYKESQIYSDLRQMLASLGETFLDDITNNSVFVPVIIVDSLQSTVIGSGNIPNSEFSTPQKLSNKLASMAAENTPIRLAMPNGTIAYVYYEQTPLLKALRWVPLLYVFIAIVLIVTSYYLFRTAHAVEQNRIWVGLAKETAHQLGTPISSLIAWTDYLENKTITPQYAQEIRKDLSRLETITHRFSKIGSTPELKETNVGDVIQTTIEYLPSRSPTNIKFLLPQPHTTMIAPLKNSLFHW
ncbi:MAG: hypothetical protein KBT04_07350, partial [Bacteroidales bacterium]|nr:hypothetical protein [Candidatus Colimorpha onthohippi]